MQFAFFRLSACSYAYQNSLFPLGISGDNIIFLEVELERYVNTSSAGEMLILQDPLSKNIIETRWKGNLRIKKSNDAKTFLLIEELAYIDISDKDYNLALLPYFEKAMEKARNELFFEEAFLLKTAGCGYERSCTIFQLEPDTLELALYCSLEPNSKQKTKIEFPKILLQKYENVTQLNFSEIETVEAESRMEFYKIWKPCSARYYRIGDRDMVIYCIGWGQKRGYNGIKEDQWKPNLLPVEQFVEGNDVMVHGQRFDSCQIF